MKPRYISGGRRHSRARREAALKGLGLTTLPTGVADEERAAGSLVQVRKDWTKPESGVYAVYPSSRMIAPKVRRLVEAVAGRLREIRAVSPCARRRAS
ncbi:LysR substrate-binding domain-containing protein [Rhodoblastus sp. 17X3]|uniref:LysR substrate-binding domain-containing protein n=1 Tax=Rhodoblastus sp. 17X3 TaxID=3047026 RepID=UPI0024B7DDAB|nr:LysR substrate-binding domain-containing protein [Rhodoblastus sp. 17X3]MDI9846933.1 LysR substrate-binding domain-containing protein [Rhodoblastus sp. 17X3]